MDTTTSRSRVRGTKSGVEPFCLGVDMGAAVSPSAMPNKIISRSLAFKKHLTRASTYAPERGEPGERQVAVHVVVQWSECNDCE